MGFDLMKRRNGALDANPNLHAYPVSSDIAITTRGSDVYWAVTAIMCVSTLAIIGMSFGQHRTRRLFHYITAAITLIAAIAYFSMASNLGWTSIYVEFHRSNPKVRGDTREIFYARYVDWFLTTPLLLLDLLLTAALPWPTIMYTILLNEVMVVTGLIGALVSSQYKWGYFAFGCAAFLGVAFNVVIVARKHAAALGSDISRTFLLCGVWTISLWFLYPIAWGLCEGGNVISPDSEAVFYAILDVLAKPVFGMLLLFGHRSIDPERLGLHIRDYADETSPSSKHEKGIHRNGHSTGNGLAGGPVEEPATTV